MTYLADWQSAKKQFEKATGQKKPSKTFLGVFRLSSGMETAAKTLDNVIKKPDRASVDKAAADYEKARIEYLKILEKADAAEKAADYSKEIDNLKKAMLAIASAFLVAAGKLLDQAGKENNKKYAPLVSPIPKNLAKIDTFLKDINKLASAQTKDALMALATGDGGARGYCTACKFWDQVLAAKMPEVVAPIYKGKAMADFFPFAQEYGANHDSNWWNATLSKKGDEDAAVKQHADWLKKHVADINKFRGYLDRVYKAVT